jgi:hypothetical protein
VWSLAGILALATSAHAQDVKPVQWSFGAGVTWPNSEVREHLGDGYNINFGLQFNVTPNLGIEGLYSFNGLGSKSRFIDMADTPGGPLTPREFSADMNMQYGTGALVFQGGAGKTKGYGLAGMGIYYRPIKVTTPGVGWVPGYCDPWWYVCYPGGWVETTNILASRSSTDFGMVFGGGVNVSYFYTELRYHYIWGPEVPDTAGVPTPPITPVPEPTTRKANGQFLQLTFGVRF